MTYKIKFKDGSVKEFKSLKGADLRYADLRGADLRGTNLKGTILEGIKI